MITFHKNVIQNNEFKIFRLDFINFVINGPLQAAGNAQKTQCQVDLFTVSGQTNNVPGICGTNTNQHSKKAWATKFLNLLDSDCK